MKRIASLAATLFVLWSCAQQYVIAESWPIFNLEGAIRTSKWIATGRVLEVTPTACGYGSYGAALSALVEIDHAIEGIDAKRVVAISVFDGNGAFNLRKGDRYFIFYRVTNGPCGSVSVNPGFLLITDQSVATGGVVAEPDQQYLTAFLAKVNARIATTKTN